jgi:hypothetical protein
MNWLQHHELYKLVPMKSKTILPDEGFGPRDIEMSPGLTFPVYCNPKTDGSHRVMVKCSCGKDIPFGRMGQHYRAHKPKPSKTIKRIGAYSTTEQVWYVGLLQDDKRVRVDYHGDLADLEFYEVEWLGDGTLVYHGTGRICGLTADYT